MAYTIQVLCGGQEKRNKVYDALQARLIKDGRFCANLEMTEEWLSRQDKIIARYQTRDGQRPSKQVPGIRIHKVRLTQKKPYCGNHPGPCPVDGKPKPNSTLLEWDDWVAFHALVNRTLNKFRTKANVFTIPRDVVGRMWIRQNDKPRLKWDYEEKFDGYRMVRYWNQGTSDQFQVSA